MRVCLCPLIIASVCGLTSESVLASVLSSPTDVTFTATYDGVSQAYMQLLPQGFDAAQQHDVIIALHGSGSNKSQYATSSPDECRATRDVAANHNMILICPDYRGTTSWMNAAAEADVVQIINDLKSRYKIGKVIITGGSMGGTGALTFTALHPDLIDGVCSVNGLANFVGYTSSNSSLLPQIEASFGGSYAQVPAEYVKRSAANSPASFTMPMSVTAGGADTVVPPASVLSLYNTVRNDNPKNANTMSFYRAGTGHSTNYVDNAVALEYVVRRANGVNTDLNPITINTSFEYQSLAAGASTGGIAGWTVAGSNATVTRLSAADYAAKFDEPIPDGGQMAVAANDALYQFLGTTVRPGTYHLSVSVASAKDSPQAGTLAAGFLVADNTVASVSDLVWGDGSGSHTAGTGPTAGKWTQVTVDWVVDADNSSIGKYLYIDLWANSGNSVYFDNVNVTFTPAPEPPAVILSLICGAGLLTHASLKSRRLAAWSTAFWCGVGTGTL